jgi:serine/threonine-protein kinase
LGAILSEMLTGRPPITAGSRTETMLLLFHLEPVPPSRLRPRVPGDLETIRLKCLHKEPRHRYPGAAELAADLKRFLDDRPIQARPVGRRALPRGTTSSSTADSSCTSTATVPSP